MITTGKPEAGLEFVETALRPNPSYPNHYVLAHGMTYFSMDRLERAAIVLNEALKRDLDASELALLLAASHALLGRREDARTARRHWQPDASQAELRNHVGVYHFPYSWTVKQWAITQRLIDGLYVAALPSDVTVTSLADTLQHGSLGERRLAARDLGRFGPQAAEAVPELIHALADENDSVRRAAATALGKDGSAAGAAVPALTAMLAEGSSEFAVRQAPKGIRGY